MRWKRKPDEHDYPAALSFLRLLVEDGCASATVAAMKRAPIEYAAAKDILRAAGLGLLASDEAAVSKHVDACLAGEKLSPVLLVADRPTVIADGYHRVCAAYHLDGDGQVPFRRVTWKR